jgi:hypothetical protein
MELEARPNQQPNGPLRHGNGPWITATLSPLVWMAQGASAWYLVGRACPSRWEPLSLGICRALIALVTLVALAVTVVGLVRARMALHDDHRPLAVGDIDGFSAADEQRRFVALLGLVAAVAMTFGLVLACLPSFVIHACGEAR